jgi:hypothetical protein
MYYYSIFSAMQRFPQTVLPTTAEDPNEHMRFIDEWRTVCQSAEHLEDLAGVKSWESFWPSWTNSISTSVTGNNARV